jgi:hypothetical protein
VGGQHPRDDRDAARVVKALENHSTTVERPNERQARELAPVAKEDPEKAAKLWEGDAPLRGA